MNKVSGEILEELRESMVGRRYRHFKGRIYIVTDLAVNTESNEIMVIYKCFADPIVTWCRPLIKEFLIGLQRVVKRMIRIYKDR